MVPFHDKVDFRQFMLSHHLFLLLRDRGESIAVICVTQSDVSWRLLIQDAEC